MFHGPPLAKWLPTLCLLYLSLEAVTTIYSWGSSLGGQNNELWDVGASTIQAVLRERHKIAVGDLQQNVEGLSSGRCVNVRFKLYWNYSVSICSEHSLCILTEFVSFKSFLVI